MYQYGNNTTEKSDENQGRSITQLIQNETDLNPDEYVWIQYPVVNKDSLWGILRKHWNWPEGSGNDKQIKKMVAMIRKYNLKSDDWRPDKGDIIYIPSIKIPAYSYSWSGSKSNQTEGIKQNNYSHYKDLPEIPSNFKGIPLTQEEVNVVMLHSIPKVLKEEYDNFRTKKHLFSGALKFGGGLLAIVGGIAYIVGSGGLAIPLVIGGASITLGATTTGLGAAELILTGYDLDAADKIGQYKNAGHTIGKCFDNVFGTEYLSRIGNFANIVVNFGSGARIGVADSHKAGAFKVFWSGMVAGIATGADILENDFFKGMALYEISKNPKAIEDDLILQKAVEEIMTHKDNVLIKNGLKYVERKIVEEVEKQKFALRMEKYFSLKKGQ